MFILFLFLFQKSRKIFDPADHEAPSRKRKISSPTPPMLLVTGQDDTTVFPRNSVKLADRLRKNGGIAETLFYEDIGHVGLVASLAKPLQEYAPTLNDIEQFLRRYRTADGCPSS